MKQPGRPSQSSSQRPAPRPSGSTAPARATGTRGAAPATGPRKSWMPLEAHLPLALRNYRMLLIALGLVILGFIFMIGKEDIYSFTKITLSVLLILAGYGLAAYAILNTKVEKPAPTVEEPK